MEANSTGSPLFNLSIYLGFDTVAGQNIPGAVLLNDSNLRVVNQYELPQVQECMRLLRQWNQNGYIRPDAITVANVLPERQAGRNPVIISGNYKPGGDVELSQAIGRASVGIPFSTSYLTTGGINATMTAVSRTTRNPDKTVQFLDLVNSDRHLFNLITKGIEGRHYTRIDANYIRFVPNSGYAPNADWMYGNQFLAYLSEGQGLTDWEDTRRLNASARTSPALGFAFDSTPVAAELANVSSVMSEYLPSLGTGSVDPDRVLPEFLEKLRGAGNQRLIAEIQRQLDAWKAAR
jgi:putative aldouronate transport system substrate-binding protein